MDDWTIILRKFLPMDPPMRFNTYVIPYFGIYLPFWFCIYSINPNVNKYTEIECECKCKSKCQ